MESVFKDESQKVIVKLLIEQYEKRLDEKDEFYEKLLDEKDKQYEKRSRRKRQTYKDARRGSSGCTKGTTLKTPGAEDYICVVSRICENKLMLILED